MKEGMPTPSNDNEKRQEEIGVDGTNVVEFQQHRGKLSETEQYGRALEGQANERFISRVDRGISSVEASFERDRQEILDRLDEHRKESWEKDHAGFPVTEEELDLEREWGEDGKETLKLGAQLYPLQFPTMEESALTGDFHKDLGSEMEHRKEKGAKNRQQAALGILGLGAVTTSAAVFGGAGLAAAMAIGGPATLAAGLGVYGGMKLYQGIRNRRYRRDAIKNALDQKLRSV